MTQMMNAAAAQWELIFPGVSRDVDVRFFWYDPISSHSIGLSTCEDPWADAHRPFTLVSPNRYTVRSE
ncbi:MAG: hypothetical protein GY723_16010 [bacterium]|nr:hypothetical protein [bacterium]